MQNGILYLKFSFYKSNYKQFHLSANVVDIGFVFMSYNEIENEEKLWKGNLVGLTKITGLFTKKYTSLQPRYVD